MILLFFAFLCGLIWRYADTSFTGPIAKSSLIPGFKAAMLVFAFILVLVDVTIFIETNRLIVTSAGSINGSCVSYTGSSSYMPTSLAVEYGSVLSGTVSSLDYHNDGDVLLALEVGGAPGYAAYANYTGVTAFDTLYFSGMTDDPSSTFWVQIQDPAGAWHTIYAFAGSTSYYTNIITVNGSLYINGSTVSVRILDDSPGNVTSRVYTDWLMISGDHTYTAYCPDSADTELVFIYHQMESSMILMLLNMLPFIAMFVFFIIMLQVLLLIYEYATGRNKKGGNNA